MVIVAIILVISILSFLFSNYKNNLLLSKTKLKKVEEKLNSNLLKRKELIKDSEEIIKKIINTKKTIYEGFDDLSKYENIVEFDRKSNVYLSEFNLIREKYSKLSKNNEFQKLAFILDETEDLIESYKKYYNDEAVNYNKLIKTFPFFIINSKKKEKEFFD